MGVRGEWARDAGLGRYEVFKEQPPGLAWRGGRAAVYLGYYTDKLGVCSSIFLFLFFRGGGLGAGVVEAEEVFEDLAVGGGALGGEFLACCQRIYCGSVPCLAFAATARPKSVVSRLETDNSGFGSTKAPSAIASFDEMRKPAASYN